MEDLTLLPENGPPAKLRFYLEHSLSVNSKRAYRTDMEHYIAWGGSIPSSPEGVAQYLTDHAGVLAISTLQRRIVSIAKAHKMQNLPDPTKYEVVRLTMRGVTRVHGKPQSQVSPIMKDDLIVMLSHTCDDLKGHRDRALLLLGFCSGLRRSELVVIKIEDLEFNSQGIILTVPRSKTDQAGVGRKIGIPRARGRTCPVQSVEFWLKLSGIETGAVFRSITKGGVMSDCKLSDRAVAEIIKFYADKAGLHSERYSGHSLRSGLATSAARHGVSSWKIRAQTGHKSDAMLSRYIRDGELFHDNAAEIF